MARSCKSCKDVHMKENGDFMWNIYYKHIKQYSLFPLVCISTHLVLKNRPCFLSDFLCTTFSQHIAIYFRSNHPEEHTVRYKSLPLYNFVPQTVEQVLNFPSLPCDWNKEENGLKKSGCSYCLVPVGKQLLFCNYPCLLRARGCSVYSLGPTCTPLM